MEVSITKEDIERAKEAKGWRGYINCLDCPLSQALRREFNCRVEVEYEIVTVGDRTYRTGQNAKYLIDMWDWGGEVNPMSVELIEDEPETSCPYDPREMAGQAIGMFHCPSCGEMVIAGMEHPNYSLLDEEMDMNAVYVQPLNGDGRFEYDDDES